MAIEQKASESLLNGGVTQQAEDPRKKEVQVAGVVPKLWQIFRGLRGGADDVPLPSGVGSKVQTPIEESAGGATKTQPGKKQVDTSYQKTQKYHARRKLSKAGYARFKERGFRAVSADEAPKQDIIEKSKQAFEDQGPNTPYKKEVVFDAAEEVSAFNLNQIIKTAADGGLDFNFTKLKSGKDVQALINAVSEMYADPIKAAKRGLVSNKETKKNAAKLLADELGLTEKILKLRRGAVLNAEEMLAVRHVLVRSAKRLERLARKIRSPHYTPEDLLNFRRQMAVHAGIQMKAKAAQTEIARALQAFNIPVGSARTPELKADMIAAMLNESGGSEVARKLAQGYLDVLEKGGRAAANKYVRKGFAQNIVPIFNEIYINGLLAWTSTHLKNLLATPAFQLYQIPENLLAGVFGATERVIRKGLGIRGIDEGVYLGQVPARLYGWTKSLKDMWIVAGKTLRTELPATGIGKIESTQYRAIDRETLRISNNFFGTAIDYLGKTIRLPGRLLQTADDFWKTGAQRAELYSEAYRTKKLALTNGKTLEEATDEAMMVLLDPRSVGGKLDEIAQYSTLTSDLKAIGKITGVIQNTLFGRILLPFAKVPTNAILRVSERSPIGLATKWKDIAGFNGPAARQTALARISLGSATLWMLSEYASLGRFTGALPRSKKQRKMLPPGWQPYSIVFRGEGFPTDSDGDYLPLFDERGNPNGPLIYVKYAGLEPVGAILGVAADSVEKLRRTDNPEDRDHIATAAVMATIDYFKELPFLQGIGDVLRAMEYEDLDILTSGPLGNMVGPIPLPYSAAQRNISRALDPTAVKVVEQLQYYTEEDVSKLLDSEGNAPLHLVGRIKGGNYFDTVMEETWDLQTKDSLIFGSKDEDEQAIQYDVMGKKKEFGVRFDVNRAVAFWNLITPFNISFGEEMEDWHKELVRLGMPLTEKKMILEGKIRLNELQASHWTKYAKGVDENGVHYTTLRIFSGGPLMSFEEAIIETINSYGYEKSSYDEKISLIRKIEKKYYDEAIVWLMADPNNKELNQVRDDLQTYKNLYKQDIH